MTGGACIRRWPRGDMRAEAISDSAASMAARISRERVRYVVPSAVSASRRVVRLINRTPRRCSNREMSFDTAEGESPTSSAAATKLPRSITRSNTPISLAAFVISELNSRVFRVHRRLSMACKGLSTRERGLRRPGALDHGDKSKGAVDEDWYFRQREFSLPVSLAVAHFAVSRHRLRARDQRMRGLCRSQWSGVMERSGAAQSRTGSAREQAVL